MASASYSDFQVPNVPNVSSGTAQGGNTWASAMTTDIPGFVGFNSANDNENQNEENYYSVLTYQKSAGDLDFQVSAFGRESEQHFTPDPIGDLFLNGEASEVHRSLYSAGLQADSSYQWGESHTIRAGGSFLATGDQNNTSTEVFNLNGAGNPTTLRSISDNYPLYGLFAGVYLQDEWKIASKLTLNYGACLRRSFLRSTRKINSVRAPTSFTSRSTAPPCTPVTRVTSPRRPWRCQLRHLGLV